MAEITIISERHVIILVTRAILKLVEVPTIINPLRIIGKNTAKTTDTKDMINILSLRKILYLLNIAIFVQEITTATKMEIVEYKTIGILPHHKIKSIEANIFQGKASNFYILSDYYLTDCLRRSRNSLKKDKLQKHLTFILIRTALLFYLYILI